MSFEKHAADFIVEQLQKQAETKGSRKRQELFDRILFALGGGLSLYGAGKALKSTAIPKLAADAFNPSHTFAPRVQRTPVKPGTRVNTPDSEPRVQEDTPGDTRVAQLGRWMDETGVPRAAGGVGGYALGRYVAPRGFDFGMNWLGKKVPDVQVPLREIAVSDSLREAPRPQNPRNKPATLQRRGALGRTMVSPDSLPPSITGDAQKSLAEHLSMPLEEGTAPSWFRNAARVAGFNIGDPAAREYARLAGRTPNRTLALQIDRARRHNRTGNIVEEVARRNLVQPEQVPNVARIVREAAGDALTGDATRRSNRLINIAELVEQASTTETISGKKTGDLLARRGMRIEDNNLSQALAKRLKTKRPVERVTLTSDFGRDVAGHIKQIALMDKTVPGVAEARRKARVIRRAEDAQQLLQRLNMQPNAASARQLRAASEALTQAVESMAQRQVPTRAASRGMRRGMGVAGTAAGVAAGPLLRRLLSGSGASD